MKKIISFLLILSMAVSLTACGSSKSIGTSSSHIRGPVTENTEETYFQEESSEAESIPEFVSEPALESKKDDFDLTSEKEKIESTIVSSESEKSEKNETGNVVTFEGVTMTLPSDFEEDSELENTYMSTKYPNGGDNIIFSDLGNVKDDFTEESINEEYEKLFDDFSGCNYFIRYSVDGCEVVEYSYDASVSDIPFTQTQLSCMLKNKIICITFSNFSGKYSQAYEDSIKSLRISD